MASNEPSLPERNPLPEAVGDEAIVTKEEVARRTCPVCVRLFDSAKAMWGHSWVHLEMRDQIHSMAPPAPLVEVAVAPIGPTNNLVVGGGIGWHPWKIDSREERDRTCPRCAKIFNSPKAMFGHLHVHYERSPSKKPKGEGSSNQVEPGLVHVERSVVVIPNNNEEVVKEADGKNDFPISIDLNKPACMEEDFGGEDHSFVSSIDLNKMPPSC